jgi:predicted AAA+ superfamily ATPase
LVVPPFYENLGKRLIKSPKVYVADSGLACHLLGIETAAELAKSPFRGVLFEGFIATEIAKAQVNSGRRRELYYFRDQQGLEVDFLVPGRSGAISLVECKAARTVTPSDAKPMARVADALRKCRPHGVAVTVHLVHEASQFPVASRAVAPGVRATAWQDFVSEL